jgi:hypothetical protein
MGKRNRTLLQGPSGADDPLKEPGISFGYRALLVLVAWLAPLFAAYGLNAFVIPFKDPGAILALLWLFPIGLFAFVLTNAATPFVQHWGLVLLLIGHAFYIAVYAILLSAKRRRLFWILYVVLLIILALNFQGCRMMGRAMEIH